MWINEPNETPQSVELRHPQERDRTLGHVQLLNQALSGSGRHWHGDHIWMVGDSEAPLATWVTADSATEADAYSTALMAHPDVLSGQLPSWVSGLGALVLYPKFLSAPVALADLQAGKATNRGICNRRFPLESTGTDREWQLVPNQ